SPRWAPAPSGSVDSSTIPTSSASLWRRSGSVRRGHADAPTRRPAMNRRRFLVRSAAAFGGLTMGLARPSAWAQAPAVVTPDKNRPQIPYGVQSGDVAGDRAIIWSRSDRPSRLVVEWDTTDAFRSPRRMVGPAALAPGDFTARVDLTELPLGQQIFYRVRFQDLGDGKIWSEPVTGSLRTPPAGPRT